MASMTKLVSERISVGDFFRGFAHRHVDYATRHYSRTYHWGIATSSALIILAPVAVIFGLGILAGAFIWRD
jgi:hypothetical protein